MASKIRVFTKKFFLVANIIVVFFFLLACFQPYMDPGKWWFVSILGLAFPFLLVIVIFFFFGWLIILKPRYMLISGVALLLGIKSITVFMAFHRPRHFVYTKEPNTIRVVSWNVARFIEMKRNNNKGSQTRLLMMDLLKQQNADVVCLQEFFTSLDSAWYPNLKYIVDNLKYPYWYFSHDVDGDLHYSGSVIFSRYPIIDSGMIRYPRPTLPDALMHADIKLNNDTLRIYTTHLQSLQFGKKDYEHISEIEHAEDSLISNSRSILSKLKKGLKLRSIQANIIHEVLGDSPYPVIFCADLNDIPNSYAYFRVKRNMQDAFLRRGFGIGRSFAALSPTLRIDYIFADPKFRVMQFNRLVKNYSDHYMLVADMELRK